MRFVVSFFSFFAARVRPRVPRAIPAVVACLLSVATVHAQAVRWDPPGGMLPVGQSNSVRLVFTNCSPKDDPVPPKVDGLTLQLYGTSSNTEIVNTSITVSRIYTFAAALTKNQRVEIPAFTVETDKGAMRVAAARFEPGAATVGRSGTPLSDAATAKLSAVPASVFAGEVFELSAAVSAAPTYYPQFTRGFEWTPDPLIVEAWSDPQQTAFTVGAEQHTGFTYRARALARLPGRFNLNAATHIVNLSVGVSGFGFFQQRQYDQYSITSNTPTVEVKALPPPPAGFSGAIGQFKLVSKVVPEKAAIGEPVTWTLELSGTGNWPDIAGLPAREVSNDFQVVQPKAKRTPAEGKIFDVTLTEDVVLVPSKAGSYTLGPITFGYFDPKAGTYKTISAPRTVVTISGPAAPQFNISLAGQPADATKAGATETASAPTPSRPPTSPAAPAGIPRDPLPGSDEVAAPFGTSRLVTLALAPFVALLGFWFWLALRQAQQTDPLRPQREARARLITTLEKLRGASGANRTALLLDWQRDTAIVWQISHAAPPASALRDPNWAGLWLESDRALYGTESTLAVDWISRAETALAGKRVPGFQPARLFLPRNLFPFAAVLAFAALVPSGTRGADDGPTAYRKGDFAAAEKTWRAALAQNPTDWIAHHNLSLALAQQERAGEAAGHASAAYVQRPADPAVRWHFALATEKAGFMPRPLAGFVNPGPKHSLARLASPATWQRVIVLGAFLAALALGAILFNAYGRRVRRVKIAAGIVFTASWALTAAGIAGVVTYGIAGNVQAVVVAQSGTLRSIPTEADTAQKTTALPAGSVALIDKSFLDGRWIRLVFENGQTGWVRKEEVVPLWK